MGLIKVILNDLKKDHRRSENDLRDIVKKFLNDMKQDVSSFFFLPEKSTWKTEIANLKPVLAARLPEVNTILHLGIGGSSLGAELLIHSLASPQAPKFHALDNIDPDHLWDILETTNPEKCLVYVISKSGSTMETLAQFLFIYKWLVTHLGEERAKNRLVFCTDPEKGDLRSLAKTWSIPCFEIPTNLGGRFSGLSAVGLFPAMVSGIAPDQLLQGAKEYAEFFSKELEENKIPDVLFLASYLIEQYQKNSRNITVLMPYSQKLKTLGPWFTQLWGESLGKNGLGLTPLASVGATDQHSILQLLRDGPQDKVVGFVEVGGFHKLIDLKWSGPRLDSFESVSGITLNQLLEAELGATRQVLTNNQKPHFTLLLPKLNEHSLGQTIFFFELLTALAGYLLEINPFDQPGVEEGKKLTKDRIRTCKKSSLV